MLLQMVVARDKHFEKPQREDVAASDFKEYNDLEFFKTYSKKYPDLQPKYRPFQLAFLL